MINKQIIESRKVLDGEILSPQFHEYNNSKNDLIKIVESIIKLLEDNISEYAKLSESDFSVSGRLKQWDSIKIKIEETRIKKWDECPDLLAFRIVVISSDLITKIQTSINMLVKSGTRKNMIWHGTNGRSRGYHARHMQIDLSEYLDGHVFPEKLKAIGAELQILTEFQNTWEKLTHNDFYKTSIGVPTAGRNRVYRLAAAINLIDDELVELRQYTESLRKKINAIFSDNSEQWKDVEIDEYSLIKVSEQHLCVKFSYIRRFARECGYRVSAWPELVRLGIETDKFITLCEYLNISKFKELDCYIDEVTNYKDLLVELLNRAQARENSNEKQAYLFDRPLTILSIIMILNQPVHSFAVFKDDIMLDILDLSNKLRK